jgi:hypothetical protein
MVNQPYSIIKLAWDAVFQRMVQGWGDCFLSIFCASGAVLHQPRHFKQRGKGVGCCCILSIFCAAGRVTPTAAFQTTENGSGVLRFPHWSLRNRGLFTVNHFMVLWILLSPGSYSHPLSQSLRHSLTPSLPHTLVPPYKSFYRTLVQVAPSLDHKGSISN